MGLYKLKDFFLFKKLSLFTSFVPNTFLHFYRRYSNIQFVVLLGLPRSGTSILLKKLNIHDDVIMFYEPMNSFLLSKSNSPLRFIPYYEFIKNLHHLDYNSNNNFAIFGEKSIFGSSKKLLIVIWFSIIFRSRVKFVLLSRDPRSRYLSYKNWIAKRNIKLTYVKSQLPKNIEHETNRWIMFSRFCNRFKDKHNVLSLEYEDMIIDPESFFNILGMFLDVDLSKIPVDDLFSSSLNKWRSDLTTSEINYIDSKTSKYLSK